MKTAVDTSRRIAECLRESIKVKQLMLADNSMLELLGAVALEGIKTLESGGKIILFGNGGSAADAQHIAAEFVGRYLRNRRALAAMTLTTNTSSLTAIGNDYSYEEIFARQVQAIGKQGDLAIGISTSGNSKNVIRALLAAKEQELVTVGMTGKSGGQMRHSVDYCFCVPSDRTPRIQEAHIFIGHALCEIIEEYFANDGDIS